MSGEPMEIEGKIVPAHLVRRKEMMRGEGGELYAEKGGDRDDDEKKKNTGRDVKERNMERGDLCRNTIEEGNNEEDRTRLRE